MGAAGALLLTLRHGESKRTGCLLARTARHGRIYDPLTPACCRRWHQDGRFQPQQKSTSGDRLGPIPEYRETERGFQRAIIKRSGPLIDSFGICAGPNQFTPDRRGNISIQDCIFFLNNQELLSTTGIHNFWARFNRERSASELYFTTSQNGRSKVSRASVQIESPD